MVESDGRPREERPALNAKARGENELRAAWFRGHERVSFVCECGDPECGELLSLDRPAYSELRASPVRFGVAPSHCDPWLEGVLERHGNHWVIEKQGAAAAVAREQHGTDSSSP